MKSDPTRRCSDIHLPLFTKPATRQCFRKITDRKSWRPYRKEDKCGLSIIRNQRLFYLELSETVQFSKVCQLGLGRFSNKEYVEIMQHIAQYIFRGFLKGVFTVRTNFSRVFFSIYSLVAFWLAKTKYFLLYGKELQKAPTAEKDRILAFWNYRASHYADQYGTETRLTDPFLRKLFDSNLDPPPACCMELGCGVGANLKALAKAMPRSQLTGIDFSESMILASKRNLANIPNAQILKADLNSIETIPVSGVKICFSRHTLQHISEPSLVSLVSFLFKAGIQEMHIQELHVRGLPSGSPITWPGFPCGAFYNHDYPNILSSKADIVFEKYYNGIFLHCIARKIN
jgi:hypothetical protein